MSASFETSVGLIDLTALRGHSRSTSAKAQLLETWRTSGDSVQAGGYQTPAGYGRGVSEAY